MQTTPPNIFDTRLAMGRQAAGDIAAEIRRRLSGDGRVRIVFAAAPSQAEVLDALVAADGIDWGRVDAFHMDEYIGLPQDAPERFANWLRRHLFDRLPFGSVHLIEPGEDPEQAARAYAGALAEAPVDIVCCGIGLNGHIAFNDPPVADFDDPLDVKVVELDHDCRRQQVEDECFATVEDVPTHAITLTVPRLLRADRIFCVVPGRLKAEAVRATLYEPVSTRWPSTVLRGHAGCTFYFDRDAAAEL